jgi:hypothetical protein
VSRIQFLTTVGTDARVATFGLGGAPAPVLEDIGGLLIQLSALGVHVVQSRYDEQEFCKYFVDLEGPRGSLRSVRDRSQ